MEIGSLVEVLNEGIVSGIKGIGHGLYHGAKEGAKAKYKFYGSIYDHPDYKNHKILKGLGKASSGFVAGIGGAITGTGAALRGLHGGLVDNDYKTPVKELIDQERREADIKSKNDYELIKRSKMSEKEYDKKYLTKDARETKKFLAKAPMKASNIPKALAGGAIGTIRGIKTGAASLTMNYLKDITKNKNPLIAYNPAVYTIGTPVMVGVGGTVGGLGGGLVGTIGGLKGNYRKPLDTIDKGFDKTDELLEKDRRKIYR